MNNELKTSRVETLCDGIFAIAMTFLIISFNDMIKWPVSMDEAQLSKALLGIAPDLTYYAQSFIILGAFWIEHHHQFHYIKHTDIKLLLINIFAMMFIALIPFSTLIVGDFGHLHVAAFLFEANLLIAGLLFYIHWKYAVSKPGMTDHDMDAATVRFYTRKNLVIPAVSIAAIAVTLIAPQIGSSMYFAVPIIILLQRGK